MNSTKYNRAYLLYLIEILSLFGKAHSSRMIFRLSSLAKRAHCIKQHDELLEYASNDFMGTTKQLTLCKGPVMVDILRIKSRIVNHS